jgi:hypothetical protein
MVTTRVLISLRGFPSPSEMPDLLAFLKRFKNTMTSSIPKPWAKLRGVGNGVQG